MGEYIAFFIILFSIWLVCRLTYSLLRALIYHPENILFFFLGILFGGLFFDDDVSCIECDDYDDL
ncbi:hypothetical protein UR09_05675 [Candidatus Nitromaritima sp. SCGC AAA799-A02]|nr:hypothetical protein UZ36_07690 [Candidatus Nitromaritima sp. SCGC AAA799-C22]KMP10621.1 hypothetical protein UR09_05675 [Candidatus Nitromaritima sp. SCGC AAA799-A02]